MRKVIEWIFRRLSSYAKIDGLWVGALGNRDDLNRVIAAMGLIRDYDPVRYARMRSDLTSIWVTVIPSAIGSFLSAPPRIHLDGTFVGSASVEAVASVIVHEATHARLVRFGYEEQHRKRLEMICHRRQLAFAVKHPDNEPVLTWLSSQSDRPSGFYRDQVIRVRHRNGEYEKARELGLPEWFVRASHRLRDFRIGQAR